MTKEETIELIGKIKPNTKADILLHACCAPCTSGVFEQLAPYFNITVLYYNPNIYPKSEFDLRLENLHKLNKHFPFKIIECEYDENEFLLLTTGLEEEKEGGKRCAKCFELRLRKAAEFAKKEGFPYFTTTLSISPYKDSDLLNEIGNKMEKEFGVKYFYSNFKKNEGYKRSIVLSKELGLYRQHYCGCRYSIHEK